MHDGPLAAIEWIPGGNKDEWQLVTWLKGNTTSTERFQAGLPAEWVIADKTASGGHADGQRAGAATARILAPTLAPGE